MLKVTLEMFREYQLGMMTFPFLLLVEDPGEWREAEVLLLKVPHYQAQIQKMYSVKAEPFRANYYLMIILRNVQNVCSYLHQFGVISK